MSRSSKVLLAVITAIGAGLRIYHLGYNSLWLDEAWTWHFSSMSWQGIWETTAYEFNPPGFYWLEHIVLYFGDSEIMLRLIPAVFGIAEIPIMYLIGKEFYRSEKAGLVASIFMAFSPFGIWYSQEARTYMVTLVLVSLAFYFWMKGRVVFTSLFAALAFWTHFYTILPFVLMSGIDFIKFQHSTDDYTFFGKPIKINWLKENLLFALLAYPVLVTTTRLFFIRTAKAPPYGMQGLDIIWNVLYALAGNSPFPVILGLLFILGMVVLWLRERDKFIILAVFLAGPLALSFAFSYLFPMLPRYLIYLLPFWILGTTAPFEMFLTKE